MTSGDRLIASLILLVALIAASLALYWAGSWVVGWWERVDRQVVWGLGAAVVVMWAAKVVAGGMVRAREVEGRERVRWKKAEVYGEVLKGQAMERELLLWGSVGMLRQYGKVRDGEGEVAELWKEMRKDLGQEVWGLKEEELRKLMGQEEK